MNYTYILECKEAMRREYAIKHMTRSEKDNLIKTHNERHISADSEV